MTHLSNIFAEQIWNNLRKIKKKDCPKDVIEKDLLELIGLFEKKSKKKK